MTTLISDPREFQEACARARDSGHRVGFVPTMGALHLGHAALIAAARQEATWTAVSIFVNPLQFSPTEDLSRYPFTPAKDMELCKSHEVDVVFAPAPDVFYPMGFQTSVDVASLSQGLEGTSRPGHFRGVCTVLTKLLCLVGPCQMWMGRKDYQQAKVVQRLVSDLHLPAEVRLHPTVRDANGLALSSRNAYLSAEAYPRALSLVHALRVAGQAFALGERRADTLLALATDKLRQQVTQIDYVALVDPDQLTKLSGLVPNRALLALAAYVGKTRLIDNMVLGDDSIP